jgi:ADP-ribose pyrophosphatase
MEEFKELLRKDGKTIVEDKYGKTYILDKDNVSVVMLAKHEDSLILISQFRPAVNESVIQLPGGGVEPGEELEEAVRREFLEETGFTCGEVQYLGYLLPASWLSNEVTHVFFTDEVFSDSQQSLEEHEKIEVITIRVEDCINLIRESKINDSELSFALLQGILKGYINKDME